MTGMYEIWKEALSEHVLARFPALADEEIYVVWDRETDRPVPFGRHSSHGRAVHHVNRLKKRG